MTAPWKQKCSPELRYKLRQVGDDLVHPTKGQSEIAVPGDVQRRDCHLQSGHRRQEFPISVHVEVPVQPATKSRARKFAYVEIHVRFGEPMRQRRRIRQAREKATSARHHIEFAAVPCTVIPAVPGSRVEEAANAQTDIALELRLGDAWGLEVQLKKLSVLSPGHNARWTNGWSRYERHTQTDHAAKAIGPQERGVPRHGGAPVVSDDHRCLCA